MEQGSDLPCTRIDAAEIRPFVSVAAMACPSEIVEHGLSAMLAGNDVFEMKGFEWREPVREVAVFTAQASTLANLQTEGGLAHLTRARTASGARLLGVTSQ